MENKRRHQRVPIDIDVSCHPPEGLVFTGRARDISLGGVYIECDRSVEFGTPLTVTAILPDTQTFVELPGIVRWHRPGGFGVQFGSLGVRETHALTAYAG